MNECIAVLIKKKAVVDEYGVERMAEQSRREVFGELKSCTRQEFYSAAQAGLKPEPTLIIWTEEYGGEADAEICGVTYSVVRSFCRADDKTELYLARKGGV